MSASRYCPLFKKSPQEPTQTKQPLKWIVPRCAWLPALPLWLFALSAALLTLSTGSHAATPAELRIDTLTAVQERFLAPPAAYRPAPLYVWNDDMQEEELTRQLESFKEQGFGGVFIHPRPGLITPYLSERWLELWRFATDECKRLGMHAYIYDENSYPSGFAGGHVPDQMPEARAVSLGRESFGPDRLGEMVVGPKTVALYRVLEEPPGSTALEAPALERIPLPQDSKQSPTTGEGMGLKPGTYERYALVYTQPSEWYGGKTYVDLLRPGVTDKFLEITFDAYDSVLTDEYGKTVLACFTDEPEPSPGWTPDMPEVFERQWGYDLLDCLYSLDREVGDWKRVRHDFTATVLSLFIERFAKPYYQACEERGIALTGHVWEHGWPRSQYGPDTMNFNAWQHIPGIDCLFNNYSEGPHAQLGNYRASAEIRSIANQMGRVRTLCEAYGGAGWETTFEDMKRIGDYLYVTGVNFFNPILSFYSLRGERKRDYPTDLSYHSPWWEAYHTSADYFGRLSWALSAGRERNELLVIEPTTSMWMYGRSQSSRERLEERGAEFQRTITQLAAEQVAFDLGSEPVISEHGRVMDGRLLVGECAYSTVVLPPGLENLERSTVNLLEAFVMQGGEIVSYVDVPSRVDGRPSDRAERIKQWAGPRWIEAQETFTTQLDVWPVPNIAVSAAEPAEGRLFHLVRELDDGYLLFVVNTSLKEAASGFATANAEGVESWDPASGMCETVRTKPSDRGLEKLSRAKGELLWDFHLPPAGSALFAIWKKVQRTTVTSTIEEAESPCHDSMETERVACTPRGTLEIERLDSNVLLLDYVDLILKGERHTDLYYYDAQTRIYQAHGFDRNPWKHAIQFKETISEKDVFPADSGFELQYPFTISKEGFGTSLPDLELVLERGELYDVSINGHPLSLTEGKWWIDRSFDRLAIPSEWLKSGRNVIVTRGRPFTIHHEPQPISLLGDFSLQSVEKGWAITAPKPLGLGGWSQQGLPCYANRVAYTQRFDFDPTSAEYVVELGDWSGVVARVDVNGEKAGYIGWRPWRLPITKLVREGENVVTVTVFGSFKNLWGPHHRGPVRGNAGPFSFPGAKEGPPPGDRYDLIEYGLNAPFAVQALIETTESR